MPGAERIVKKIKTMKTLPHIAVRLTRMIADDQSSLQTFEEVIRLDPTLVLRLLRLVNSPFYALASRVESIAEAVAFVGMDNLRNLIVMDIFRHIIQLKPSGAKFSRVRLWRHSAAVGITSQMICERVFEIKGEDAFLCGLIHDIGLIIEDQAVPERFSRAVEACLACQRHITWHEKEEIGTDHTRVGQYIAQDWKLSPQIQEGIQNHHKAGKTIAPDSIAGIVQISQYLVNRMEFSSMPCPPLPLPQGLVSHIHDKIHEYKSIAMDMPDELKKADDLFSLDPENP